MAAILLLCFLIIFSAGIHPVSSVTDLGDAAILISLKNQWQNTTPPSWATSDDPCGAPWEGVSCKNSRVISLSLLDSGLAGELGGDIGGLTELTYLGLAYNGNLTGSLPPQLGDLRKLTELNLVYCGFNGEIPDELGNLSELSSLGLNSNFFSGPIPPSLGKLSKLKWLGLRRNQLTGSLPVSSSNTSGLDLLKNATHFLLDRNRLSGTIPANLFRSDMVLQHLQLYENQFSGEIPATVGLVQTLEILRLDGNSLTGSVPSTLNNLANLRGLSLANNTLTGALPDFSGLNVLEYVDLSNNTFEPSEAPPWFSTLESLQNLIMEYGSLYGPLPQKLFSFHYLNIVRLRNNGFNATLNMGSNVSNFLVIVDLQNNQISSATLDFGFNHTLMLNGNPVCFSALANTTYCDPQQV